MANSPTMCFTDAVGKSIGMTWLFILRETLMAMPDKTTEDLRTLVHMNRAMKRLSAENPFGQILPAFAHALRSRELDCLTPSKDMDLTEGLHPNWSPTGNVLQHTPPGS